MLFACSDNSSVDTAKTDKEHAVNESAGLNAEAEKRDDATIASGVDYHSFANPNEVRVTHLSLDLTANFETKQLVGDVTLDVKRAKPENNTLVLDTRALDIDSVTVNGESVPFEIATPVLIATFVIDLVRTPVFTLLA